MEPKRTIVVAPGEGRHVYKVEFLARSEDTPRFNLGLITVQPDHGGGFAYALAEKGLIDEYEVYLNPLVWGDGNVHVLGDRGTVRMELDDVKRFDSGVVLLTYLPASSD